MEEATAAVQQPLRLGLTDEPPLPPPPPEIPPSGDWSGDSWFECVDDGVVQLPDDAPPPLPPPFGRRGGIGGGCSTGIPECQCSGSGFD